MHRGRGYDRNHGRAGFNPRVEAVTSVAPRKARLADVAVLAGVSIATASKALNGRSEVSKGTRDRVHAAAAQLAFEHNSVARSLSTGRMGAVGLLTSDLEGRFSLPILMGAEDALGAEQTAVLLSDARGERIREQRHLGALIPRVDALMVVGSRTDTRRSLGSGLPLPTVYVYTPSEDEDDCSLVPDNVEGGRLAARHMVDTGRRRLLHVTGPGSDAAARDRRIGIDDVLADSPAELVLRTEYGEWTERWGRSATLLALRDGVEFDGIICDSDQIARGALDALLRAGKRVPTDVGLIGYDNWELVTADTSPPISSIDMNLEAMGQRAAQLLTRAIAGEELPRGVQLMPCRLIARASTLA